MSDLKFKMRTGSPFEMLCMNKTKILSLYLVYPHYFRYNKRKAHTGEKYEFSGIFTGKGI